MKHSHEMDQIIRGMTAVTRDTLMHFSYSHVMKCYVMPRYVNNGTLNALKTRGICTGFRLTEHGEKVREYLLYFRENFT